MHGCAGQEGEQPGDFTAEERARIRLAKERICNQVKVCFWTFCAQRLTDSLSRLLTKQSFILVPCTCASSHLLSFCLLQWHHLIILPSHCAGSTIKQGAGRKGLPWKYCENFEMHPCGFPEHDTKCISSSHTTVKWAFGDCFGSPWPVSSLCDAY